MRHNAARIIFAHLRRVVIHYLEEVRSGNLAATVAADAATDVPMAQRYTRPHVDNDD